MDLTSIWRGEKVKILKSGRIGIFEGINKDGKARIKTNNKILLISASNLEIIPEVEHHFDIDAFLQNEQELHSTIKPKLKIKFDHTLDLHIDKLAPHMENDIPARIIEFQLQKSETFIRNAIDNNYPHITIIHGKGQGVLKAAIEHQLTLFHQLKIKFSTNGGGAVEVWL